MESLGFPATTPLHMDWDCSNAHDCDADAIGGTEMTTTLRKQLSLFPVEEVDQVFGLIEFSGVCPKCKAPTIPIEDSEPPSPGFAPEIIEEVCSNAECEG